MIRSAALGGVFIGVLSALPLVSAGNCCCCMWMISGGALAAYLEVQQKDRTLTGGEGAAIGALSGVIGAFVWIPIAVAMAVLLGPLQRAVFEEIARNARDMPPEAREVFENMGGGGSAVGYAFLFMKANGSQLREITRLIESGAIRPVIDRVFPFDSTNEALAYVEAGRAKGKVVIKIK